MDAFVIFVVIAFVFAWGKAASQQQPSPNLWALLTATQRRAHPAPPPSPRTLRTWQFGLILVLGVLTWLLL